MSVEKLSSKVKRLLIPGINAFAIVNLTMWIGNIFMTMVYGKSKLSLVLFDFDIGIILIIFSYYQMISDWSMYLFIAIGWAIAGVYAKKVANRDANMVIVIAALFPGLLITIIFGVLFILITIGEAVSALGSVLLLLLIILLLVSFLGLAMAIPGFFMTYFVSKHYGIPTMTKEISQYLVVFGVVPNEPVVHCPFRMQDKPGCAFLGYQAPDNMALICDYQSKWVMCKIYDKLYNSLDDEFKKVRA